MSAKPALSSLALILIASMATAEVSVRECILFAPLSQTEQPQLIVVPASTTVDLATMQFQLNSTSDAVFEIAVMYVDSATVSSSRSRYSVHIDSGGYNLGSPIEYFLRSPTAKTGNLNLRAFFQAIPSGLRTATVRVHNTATTPLQIAGVWITPLFVDSTEVGITDQRFTAQSSAPSTWTTLGWLFVPSSPADRSLVLSAYVRGSAPGEVSFRITSGGSPRDSFVMNFHNRDDGGIFNFIFENPTPGAQMLFQAQGQAAFTTTEFAAQTVKKYTLLEAFYGGPGLSLPSNFAVQTIAESPDEFLNSLSLTGAPAENQPNQHQICLWGSAYAQMSKASTTMARLDANLAENGTYFGFDIGLAEHAPDSIRDIYRDQVDLTCGPGLFSDRLYRVRESVLGACPDNGLITVSRARMQVLVLPAPNPNTHTCTTSFDPTCPYACQLNPALALVLAPARNFCSQ